MEPWQKWDDFLKIMSRDNQLTDAETESFLLQFNRQNIGKSLQEISAQLPQTEDPLGNHKKRMSEVYDKFSQENNIELKPKNNKSKPLQKWLETKYFKWLPVQESDSALSSATTEMPIDLQKICRLSLEKQKQLTTNRLMHTRAMVFNLDDIDVDLALVERKESDKRSGDDRPEKSRLYQPDYEETEKLEYQEFLAKVLNSNQINKIAVIGEPGAGKTTLLQRIAFWILENTDYLPIWIPLGNLPTPAPQLKEYLLNHWLEDTMVSITPEIRANFEKQLTVGKVWLLLDGVDEMAASGTPLTFVDKWIPAWSHNLPVMLTCRLNVWEANPYVLNRFQTYRTLWFSEEKVKKFIHDGFQKSNPKLGGQLQEELDKPGKERIKDLVKNPLRLMLLCSIWHLLDGKLPDTKAELYQQYVEEVYRWKEEEFPTTPERQQLNAKLGELSKKAIDEQENRFCLQHKFIEGVFNNDSLFQLALKVGWLNQVEVDAAKKTLKPVYAFFHPTFQEYFAATVIDDWKFFLPRQHQDKPVPEKYRIFEPQWKEVYLMWLEREDVEEKEELLQKLVKFKDGCGGFYHYQANFIAAAGVAAFRNYSESKALVQTIVNWSVGDFTNQQFPNILTPQPSQNIPNTKEFQNIWINPVQQAALVALQETDSSVIAKRSLENLQSNNNQESDLLERIRRRQLFKPTRPEEVDRIIEAVRELPNDSPILWKAIETLGQIEAQVFNENILRHTIDFLLSCIGCEYYSFNKRDDLYIGWKAIYHLANIVNKTHEEEAKNILINRGLLNLSSLSVLNNFTESEREYLQENYQKVIDSVRRLYVSDDVKSFENLASILPEPKWFSLMVKALKNYLTNQENRGGNSNQSLQSLAIIDKTYSDLHLDGYTEEDRFDDCYKTIWYSAQALSYPDFYEAWHFP